MSEDLLEEWRPIGPYHDVSNLGRVRSWWNGNNTKRDTASHLMRQDLVKGYPSVRFGRRKRYYVHTLVLEAFSGPRPQGKEAAHLDGNPKNNAIENLMWATRSENNLHKRLHGTAQNGGKATNVKLTAAQVRDIRLMADFGFRGRRMAEWYEVNESTISRIVTGKAWL